MPLIEIDADLCEYFKAHETLRGESPSGFLRRLLRQRGSSGKPPGGEARRGTDLQRFLEILSDMCRRYPEAFARIARVRGRTRIYFSQDPDEIRAAGQSTAPVKIPDTDWWVTSNTSTEHKLRILTEVFGLIDCSLDDRQRWLAIFGRPATGNHEAPLAADDDPFRI